MRWILENKIIQLLINGYNKNDIASQVGRPRNEIDKEIENIYSKYNVSNRVQLAVLFSRKGAEL